MKTYIIHYSKTPERKRDLLNDPNFKVLDDVTWIDWYDGEDLFCHWLKDVTKSEISTNLISNSVKHYEAFRLMVENEVSEAFIFEDDVVFRDGWLDHFNKSGLRGSVPFCKLDCLHSIPFENRVFEVGNPGGSEARYVTLEFAKAILKEVDFSYSPDIMHGAFLMKYRIPMLLYPICGQTSIIESKTSHSQPANTKTWREYISWYISQDKHLDYYHVLRTYQKFLDRKKLVEDEFFKTYSRKVDITKFDYIYTNELVPHQTPYSLTIQDS